MHNDILPDMGVYDDRVGFSLRYALDLLEAG